jgi:hypothetical protein
MAKIRNRLFPARGSKKERDVEISRLKKELREAQLENEILKKAVAITSAPLSTGFTHPKR